MVSPLLLEISCNISKPLTTHELIHVLSLKIRINRKFYYITNGNNYIVFFVTTF